MDVPNLFIVACQDRKALCSTLLPWLIYDCRCLIIGTCNAVYKFVTSMVLCGLGMQQYTMHSATIQKKTFFDIGVCHRAGSCMIRENIKASLAEPWFVF